MTIEDFHIKSVKEAGDLSGKYVILRLDLNVPIEKGKITDDFRIKKALPVLNFLRDKGAIILAISHLDTEGESLRPVADYLRLSFLRRQESRNLNRLDPRLHGDDRGVTFIKEIFTEDSKQKINGLKSGDVVLFENIRQCPEEEKNDERFAKRLAALGDLYVNDAFPASHRRHASIVGVPKFLPHYAGLQLEEEIEHLSLSNDPKRPFLFILGGAKFDTKLPLIQKFLEKADNCFIGGALANDLFKAKGFEVGHSVVSGAEVNKAVLNNPKLILPADVVVKNGDVISNKLPKEVTKEDKIMDAGPKTVEELSVLIHKAKLVLWNGPLGLYESGFDEPTHELAKMISQSGAETILGGGDTIGAIRSLGIDDKFTFVSTGGGAMLEFLLNDTLPGIEALK